VSNSNYALISGCLSAIICRTIMFWLLILHQDNCRAMSNALQEVWKMGGVSQHILQWLWHHFATVITKCRIVWTLVWVPTMFQVAFTCRYSYSVDRRYKVRLAKPGTDFASRFPHKR